MPKLIATNLEFRYPGTTTSVFSDVTFQVDSGEVVYVSGRNGTGKTTLLKVLAGILHQTDGEVSTRGKCVYMNQFSETAMSPSLSVKEHLRAFAVPSYDALRVIQSFELGLERRLDEFTGHLSGGQKQVLALVCALAMRPAVLCLDEFTSSMDVKASLVAQSLLEQHTSENEVALVLVSHKKIDFVSARTIDLGAT